MIVNRIEDVAAFAGSAIEQAVFYPEDDRFLVERDRFVTHYEVAADTRRDTWTDKSCPHERQAPAPSPRLRKQLDQPHPPLPVDDIVSIR